MTAANRVDSLTDLALSYNNQKHVDMAQLLVRKLTMTQNRIPDLVADLRRLLVPHGLTEDDIPPVVAELKALAAELGRRDDNSTGQGIDSAIEIVGDSMRARLAAPERMADISKTRAKIWRHVRQNRLKLTRLLKRYRAVTSTDLKPEDVRDGRFPWHEMASERAGTPRPIAAREARTL